MDWGLNLDLLTYVPVPAFLAFFIWMLLRGSVVVGYVPPEQPVRLNLDRFGLPRDYATYVWLLYGKRVEDKSPQRRALLRNDWDPRVSETR